MQVLVMGGTRFNGLALVNELVKHGHEVTIFNRGESDADIPDSVTRLYGDRHDNAGLRATFSGLSFDCIQDISAYTLADVKGILDSLHGRFQHYIFAGSTVVYARSNHLPITEEHPIDRSQRQSTYGLNKLYCEDYLMQLHKEQGLPVSVVPFSMVFGPHNNLIDREFRMYSRIAAGRYILIPGDGTTLSQIGHVYDEAVALRMMMLEPATFGRRYNLTGKDYWSDEGYVDTFADVMETKVNKVFVPAKVMEEIWDNGNASQYLIQRVAPYVHPWNESTLFSIDRLRQDIGWEPAFSFPAAVAQTHEWFLRQRQQPTYDFGIEDRLLQRLAGMKTD